MLPLRLHEAPAPRLVIAANAEWFQIRGRAPVVLETRVPLRRLLLALGELRLHSPSAVLPVTAAFEAGWPGERASPTAAAMRVYTAVHSLRRLGLRGLLVRRRRGYVLDIDVELAAPQSQFPRALEPADEREDMAHSA
ncbi:MAG: hypothetical protein KF850_33675 [Labilithrix sp.]|nr:hypothetical protein [Labilithrix sp.]